MTDIVVTIPRARWPQFIAAYDRSGAPCSRQFCKDRPPLAPGDFLFFAAHGRIRCALAIDQCVRRGPCLLVAGAFRPGLTIDEKVAGFPGWRRAWFSMRQVIAFPEWRSKGVWYPPVISPDLSLTALADGSVDARDDELTEPLPAYAHGKTRSEQGGCS